MILRSICHTSNMETMIYDKREQAKQLNQSSFMHNISCQNEHTLIHFVCCIKHKYVNLKKTISQEAIKRRVHFFYKM